ncbi:hypothetical protein QJS66_12910 [Kocuria rhizophila]|nr:hypothetical protein QJS66_12910 [Kocuria rhizophila]
MTEAEAREAGTASSWRSPDHRCRRCGPDAGRQPGTPNSWWTRTGVSPGRHVRGTGGHRSWSTGRPSRSWGGYR